MILTHGSVVLARATPETRGNGLLAIPPAAFLCVQTDEFGTLTMKPLDLDALQVLAPDRYRDLMAELRADRDVRPIVTLPAKD